MDDAQDVMPEATTQIVTEEAAPCGKVVTTTYLNVTGEVVRQDVNVIIDGSKLQMTSDAGKVR